MELRVNIYLRAEWEKTVYHDQLASLLQEDMSTDWDDFIRWEMNSQLFLQVKRFLYGFEIILLKSKDQGQFQQKVI